MPARARMALLKRPQLPERDSNVIYMHMAMHVGSNAAAPDYSVRQLGASESARPLWRGWTASWSTGFVDYYPNSFLLVTCNLYT